MKIDDYRRYVSLLTLLVCNVFLTLAQPNIAIAEGLQLEASSEKIAFVSNRDGNSEIYVMNADGSNQTRLTNNSAWDGLPDWSPDGSKIIFSSNRDGNTQLFVMEADGSNQTRLISTTNWASDPAW